jgi:serine/threonine protein kinase
MSKPKFSFAGSGTYAVVYKIENHDKKMVVLKKARKELEDFIDREADILSLYDSPYIIKVLYRERGLFWMDFIEMELFHYITKYGVRDKKKVIFQLLSGLKDIHAKGYVHCDIKPTNIMINKEEDIVYIDFNTVMGHSTKTDCEIVSTWYRPPELICKQEKMIDYSIDVWSLGCTIYHVVYGDHLFVESQEKILLRKIMKYNYNFSGEFGPLLKDMLQIIPEKRITLQQALDKYFAN